MNISTVDYGAPSRAQHSHFLKDFEFELLALSTLINAEAVAMENCLAEWWSCCSSLSKITAHAFRLIKRPQTESYSRLGSTD